VQEFINSLLPFAPDLLVIADKFVGSNGDPVASAPDSSGNNNPMFQATGVRQPHLASGPNGKKAYAFVGVAHFLQCPFQTGTKGCSIIVYNSTPILNVNSNRVTPTQIGLNQGYSGPTTPLFQYIGAAGIEIHIFTTGDAQIVSSTGTWRSCASWLDGVNSNIKDGLGHSSSAVGFSTPDAATYAGLGGDGNVTSGYFGSIAFHARWITAPSPSNITSFLSLVDTYYGL
jgi:hypothetical protein